MIEKRGDWRRVSKEPNLTLAETSRQYLGDLSGQRACVLGSGDNLAAFALAGLGAAVTSVDISDAQLNVARRRAAELGLSIAFVRADVTDLSMLESETCDVVYTGGHVAVWVSDLQAYYDEAARLLKPDGLLLIDEYHPFRRCWAYDPDALRIAYSYYQRGPFASDLGDDILHPGPGSFKAYEFHWTISDYVNAVLQTGCHLLRIDEHGRHVGEWEGAPLHGLPEYFLMIARKEAGGMRAPHGAASSGLRSTRGADQGSPAHASHKAHPERPL